MSVQKQTTLPQKQNGLIEKQNVHTRKKSQSRKFINMVTPALNRQSCIKNVREIKKNAASLHKGLAIVPVQQLFALKNIENEEEKGIRMMTPMFNHRKMHVRKQPKPKIYAGLVKFSISLQTDEEKRLSQVWTRENSPINRLLEVSRVRSNPYQ